MRRPERIQSVVGKLKELWELYPDLRFWQLINVALGCIDEKYHNTDPFYWEDHVWEAMLSAAIERQKDFERSMNV